jgi:hypothetical protein
LKKLLNLKKKGSAINEKGGKEVRDEVAKLHKTHGNLAVGGGNFIF